MGRRRKRNLHLPRWMVHRHGAYYMVVRGKYTRLGAEYGPALIRYAELVGGRPEVSTVGDLVASYIATNAQRLAEATIQNYQHSAARLAPVFGHMALGDLTAAHVYRYLVEHGTVSANRDRALLSAAYTHARLIGAFDGKDPTKGLQFRNPEAPRKRYVTDAELDALLAAASPKLACIIRLAYLTGMRQGDLLRLRLADIGEEGITFTTHKTNTQILIVWTDELRAAVDDARKLWRRFGRDYLFESRPRGKHAKRGPGPYTTSGLQALWRVARDKSGIKDVRLQDLRRKAASDFEDEADASKLLGHADPKTTRRHYRAKPTRAKPAK